MNKIVFLSFYILATSSVFAQDDRSAEVTSNLFSLDFLAPGVRYEYSLNTKNTIGIGGHAGFVFYYYDNVNGETGSEFLVVPVITTQYRHYYNFEKRNLLGKKTWFNSANYFAFKVQIQTEPIAGDVSLFNYQSGALIGPAWGIQRNGVVTFNLDLGLGYYTGTSEVSPMGDIRIGLNLSKL